MSYKVDGGRLGAGNNEKREIKYKRTAREIREEAWLLAIRTWQCRTRRLFNAVCLENINALMSAR